jgi:pyroglutamyl-peptidase
MPPITLLTSFTTWEPHQRSNASDDLLQALFSSDRTPRHIHLLRQMPVDFELAPALVIDKIQAIAPDWVICCGMAETRTQLSLEVQAVAEGQACYTTAHIPNLLTGLRYTHLSYDAGRFVCNYLYYSILAYLAQQKGSCQCIFIHVPILTPENTPHLRQDLRRLLSNIGAFGHDS